MKTEEDIKWAIEEIDEALFFFEGEHDFVSPSLDYKEGWNTASHKAVQRLRLIRRALAN
jgi:hypothetical protein